MQGLQVDAALEDFEREVEALGIDIRAAQPGEHGLYVMDTPGHDIEQMVGLVAGGCQIVAFTTGRGTPTGSADRAVPEDLHQQPRSSTGCTGDIDLDAGRIVDGTVTLAEMGEEIYDARSSPPAPARRPRSERAGQRASSRSEGQGNTMAEVRGRHL